jgi:hypothetical protein
VRLDEAGMSEDQDRLRRLRAALRDIHWSAEALAGAVGFRSNTARRIVSGARPISDWLLTWLEDLAAYHRAHPPPPPQVPEDSNSG